MDDRDPDTLLTGREAAAMLRLSGRTMERLRSAGGGPRYVVLGMGRAIRYRRNDLLDYIEQHARRSTSEPTR
jgi:predicted DNA-binding transcriptional regulator AlpA